MNGESAFHRDVLSVLRHFFRGEFAELTRWFSDDRFRANRAIAALVTQRLGGFFYAEIVGTDILDALGPDARDQLKAAYKRQWARGEQLQAELSRVERCLAAANIQFAVLKGAFLADRFYGDLDRRAFADIDLLVRPQDVAAVHQRLLSLGYARDSRMLLPLRWLKHFTHAFEYHRDTVPLDLHWVLISHPSARIAYERLWHDTKVFRLGAGHARVLSDPDALLFGLVAAFRDAAKGQLEFRSMVDLQMILSDLEPHLEFDGFLESCRDQGLGRIALAMMGLVAELFDASTTLPALARFLAQQRTRHASLVFLLDRQSGTLPHRLWAIDQYSISPAVSALWWIAGLPSRLAASRGVRVRRRHRATPARP